MPSSGLSLFLPYGIPFLTAGMMKHNLGPRELNAPVFGSYVDVGPASVALYKKKQK